MEVGVVVFLIVVLGTIYGGVRLIGVAMRPPREPPVPTARTANAEGAERVHVAAARVSRGGRKLGRAVLFSAGIAVLAGPWLLLYALYRDLKNMSFGSKGRVLRIRNRAQLPELAHGTGWSGDPVSLRGALTELERSALGELWLLTARMEHASVAAFSQLGLHLTALGAPARLLEATHRAALDEIRHAQACFAIANAITGGSHSAGPIHALAGGPRSQPIDLTRLAIGSLVDGCLAEGIAADVALRGSRLADEPAIREALTAIARDEAGHAELAWDVLVWALAEGGASVHDAVRARVDALGGEVSPRLPDIPGLDDAALARHGVIDQDALGELARVRVAAVQERARRMLDASEPAAVAA